MWLYSFKRLIQGILTVWFIATATFFVMHNVPGDPLSSEKAISPEIRENLEAKYGLDKPVHQQYFIYMETSFGVTSVFPIPRKIGL